MLFEQLNSLTKDMSPKNTETLFISWDKLLPKGSKYLFIEPRYMYVKDLFYTKVLYHVKC